MKTTDEVDLFKLGGDINYPLDDLLRKVSPENLHQEVDFGEGDGMEAW